MAGARRADDEMEPADIRSAPVASGQRRNAGWPLELQKGRPPLAGRIQDQGPLWAEGQGRKQKVCSEI